MRIFTIISSQPQLVEPELDGTKLDLFLAAVSWILLVLAYVYNGEWSLVLFIPALITTFRCLPKPYKDRAKKPETESCYDFEILEFGENSLMHKRGEVIVWHIPYERLKSLQCHEYDTGIFRTVKNKEYLVLTNDSDSYFLTDSMDESQFEEIQCEIEKVKLKEQAVA
ncbi:hypothetical protein [Litoribrevibacter albus]|uniref:Uncharacterized protein n=1 Tax=Litoribrevibacter albus TaxID=1473156 RepID=A0AA37SE12_9GAMM|nr:hypothetical protein [Litoribrevibacter albus]GLQ33601.1 hypothetical protein GCM10007876_40810 [Litoribrevibacter albus]